VIYLLDTNIVSALMEAPGGRIAERIAEVAPASILTSIIVLGELRYGIAWRQSEKLQRRLDVVLAQLKVEPWHAPADEIYGRLRAELRRTGTTIGGNDALIAAHALTLGAVMVTDNVREFGLVPGLRVENWLRD
jgi:tRNA(fMet)-specific endonuclease VapC